MTFRYTKPDKYEKWVGITDVERKWVWDNVRRCWYQKRNYPLTHLERVYITGYRDPKFRGETIQKAFSRISKLPYGQSENRYRINWFLKHFGWGRVLDIGAGIGVFANALKSHGWNVDATEENLYSHAFLNSELKIRCYDATIEKAPDDYDVVCLIHVLEHIEDLNGILKYSRERLKSSGRLFVEVPDAVEFEYLPEDSDEFNSCHVWFFDVPSLYGVVSELFDVNDIHRVYYPERKRSRIMLSATVKQ